MNNWPDGQLIQMATDPENQPNQWGLTEEACGAIIEARNWARHYRRCYEGCKAVAGQMLRQAHEKSRGREPTKAELHEPFPFS